MASSIINSDDGLVSGTSGIKTTGGDDGVLIFQSSGTETARLVSGLLSVPANSTAASAVRLYEDTDNGTNYVDIIAPAAIASDRTLTIPDASGIIDRLNRAGNVLQVVQTVKDDVFSQGAGIADVTGMTASITPSSASNKIMVMLTAAIGGDTGAYVYVFLFRGATQIATSSGAIDSIAGTLIGDNQIIVSNSINFLDSPNTTSSVTYKIQLGNAGSGTAYINRRGLDTVVTGNSTLTLMEIAA